MRCHVTRKSKPVLEEWLCGGFGEVKVIGNDDMGSLINNNKFKLEDE